jgi:hypothetical protein
MERVTNLQVAFAGVAATVVGFAITYPLRAVMRAPFRLCLVRSLGLRRSDHEAKPDTCASFRGDCYRGFLPHGMDQERDL